MDVSKPIAWVRGDRLVVDDKTVYGLRRIVVARKGDLPELYDWLTMAQKQAGMKEVYFWLVMKDDGFGWLWLVWKEL